MSGFNVTAKDSTTTSYNHRPCYRSFTLQFTEMSVISVL